MTGTIDDYGRALLRTTVRHPTTAAFAEWEAWVDTACTGELVLPQALIASLGLQRSAAAKVGLGDGSEVMLETYTCLVDWFGVVKHIEAVGNLDQFPLIGVGLMEDHVLNVDYPARTVSLV